MEKGSIMKRILIKNGLVIDPANQVQAKLNILLEDGKIAAVTTETLEADHVIDAAGKIVSPGFIDIHMHEDPVTEYGTIYCDEEKAIFPCMLRMGSHHSGRRSVRGKSIPSGRLSGPGGSRRFCCQRGHSGRPRLVP